MKNKQSLLDLRILLDDAEKSRFSPAATLSCHAVRRREEDEILRGHRQEFSVDTDRILHSLAYSRYIDKTQVFYLIRNDHITHRVLHVQLVSKIARTVGRLLSLNEDLIEAIALGHDIGHTPFGHDGEQILSSLCEDRGIGKFLHNIQSVRFLQEIERKGRGWNLTLQVLDGILTHDGEIHSQALRPHRDKDFDKLDGEILLKAVSPDVDLRPMTLEGCTVRMADTISYVGRDIEDAIRLGLIKREDIPAGCKEVLGETNGTIVYNLVEDLISNSLEKDYVCFSARVGDALKDLKKFNETNIYKNYKVKEQNYKIRLMFELLFEKYIKDIENGNEESDIYMGFLDGMSYEYRDQTPPAGIVRDFIAGMTDEYFLSQCHKNLVPRVVTDL
ncbi:Phosphohydrolase-associated domain containing protein [uncultured Desulfobacterium sp.]|uniref:Phosphohydrolase-associated domain containing protein n=1 Tax=uncultured Desulfobacterium sp. TaxID=201089 RepID=A0A445N210_9BACT|nr:Phosphohydrolase-associated domain containing protein [uncultured Desulfobacterium sp.]